MMLGLSLWFWKGNIWEIERSNKQPSLPPPPQALQSVGCSAVLFKCWSWDLVAVLLQQGERRTPFFMNGPNDWCTIFFPGKACQVLGISGYLVLNTIHVKFHLINRREFPEFCVLCFVLFFVFPPPAGYCAWICESSDKTHFSLK